MRTNLKIAAALCAFALAAAPAAARAEVLLSVDFDNHPLGPYTATMGKADFHYPGYTWQTGMDQGRGEVVPGRDGKGRALRMLYPAGKFGANDQAVQIRAALAKAVDTAWASYWVMFEDGFDFVKGGKLPGLCGGRCITGGNDADGYNGWSARVMWRREGVAEQYVYYTANNGYGEDMLFDKAPPKKRFAPGKWHRINTQVIMNTPGVPDGVIRSWFDGELSIERTDLLIRHTDTLKIDLFYISTFFGGSDATWAPGKDTYITFDDFLVVSDPKSSPYPQVLYELSETFGRAAKNRPFTVQADLSASLGNVGAKYVTGPAAPTAFGPDLYKTANQWSGSWSYDIPGVSWIMLHAGDYVRRGGIITIDDYGLLCDSAWQAAPIPPPLFHPDGFEVFFTVVDPAAKILIGPTINDNPAGEYSFFGALKLENGKFSVLNGSTYVDKPTRSRQADSDFVDGALDSVIYETDVIDSTAIYRVGFNFNFTTPMTYTLTFSVHIGYTSSANRWYSSHVWENMGYRGYAKEISHVGTWASRDRAGAVYFETWSWPSGIASHAVSAIKGTASARQRGNGLSFSIPTQAKSPVSTQIEIFNAKGALVKRVQAGGKSVLFIPVASKGLYLYRVTSGGEIAGRGSVVVR